MTLATLLDPRFKTIGFSSQSNAQTAVRRLTSECAAVIRAAQNTPSSQISSSPPSPHSGKSLWDLLDSHVVETRQMKNATADATVEVQRYLSDPNIPRTEDPLHFWATQKGVYPHLHCLALEFLCTPASSVPSPISPCRSDASRTSLPSTLVVVALLFMLMVLQTYIGIQTRRIQHVRAARRNLH
ncbi:zinc finger BED domain-containing protein [Pimephales promelas]|nr:zinc finger BED domain-containing protein [Pimephales promelas]